MRTALVTHRDYPKHVTGPTHPERPERMQAILDGIAESGLSEDLLWVTPEPIEDELLQAVHSRGYIEHVRLMARRGGGRLDPDTVVSGASYEVALLSAGGAVAAVSAVLEGRTQTAFAAIRPPGHHALSDRGMGFCVFNNAACAAVAARQRFGLSRICIIDWDVHHGNGTQAIFYRDRTVLYLSTHREYWYPGTGTVEETGEGDGVGFTMNIPLPAQTGDEGYRLVFEEIVVPVIESYGPELVLISAGYDAHYADPLGGMLLSAPGFQALTELVCAASRHASRRVAAVLEGGYDLTHLSRSVVATLEAFTGRSSRAGEPPAPPGEVPYRVIQSRVRQVRSVIRNYWNI